MGTFLQFLDYWKLRSTNVNNEHDTNSIESNEIEQGFFFFLSEMSDVHH